jgi:RNA polymerase sigma-70 factor, ECF subfamily
MTVADLSDLALFDRLRAGDPAALEPLMERFASRVYRVANGICASSADAEEVVQDVFVTLFRKAASFEGRAALGTWLYRIAVNSSLNRRRGKRAKLEEPLEDLLPTYLEDGHRSGDRSFLLADWSAMPDEALLSKEGRDVIRAAVERLPEHYRAVLMLRDVEELSSEEVAEVLGESVASVKSRLHRARMALRELVTRNYAPGCAVPAAIPSGPPTAARPSA